MAKVISLFKLSGTISDLTFRQTKDGPVAQMKPGPTRERVLHSERFRSTRLNAAEFKLAIAAGKLLRDGLGIAKEGMRVASLNGRMNGLFYKAAMGDREHCRGERYAWYGDIQLLAGFDFNKDLLLANALPPGIRHHLDAATGVMQVEVPAFIARKKKGFPKEATHFRIVSGGAVIDPKKRSHRNDVKESELLPLRKKTPEAICLVHQLEAGGGEVLVQVLGIQLYKWEDGREVLLQGGALRILEVVRAEKGNEGTRHQGNEVGEGIEATGQPGKEVEEGNGAMRQQGNEGLEGISEGKEMRIGVRVPGGKGLLICRSSEDLHYICDPSDGISGLRAGYEATGAPANDP
ncbi:hypothetical protein D3H65_32355 [Paraflavitalea soli]|uniref:Uncharacterized protein n=1 Tax=Paraflavitalea soli TaxID=2315862 RepID=A0A3B7MZ80_9BACT|nr:hypothetical protein [Paraflavitalea soli]AXY78400.1 hypothetical protein D3H65_32355 [Paraflavitalea soli]